MIKSFIVSKLTQLSAWLGLITILGAFAFPRSWIVLLGAIMILTDDAKLQQFFAKRSPKIKEWLDKYYK